MDYAFISYSSTDHEFVTKFAEALKQAGRDVWFDRWNITGREPYWDEIQAGIEGCTHFIFVISLDSISSTSGARKELYHASGLKSPPTIIPIMGRDTPFEKLPILISPGEFEIHDFVHQPFDAAFQQVLTAIQAMPSNTVGRRAALKRISDVLPVVKADTPVAPTQAAPVRNPSGRGRILAVAAILIVLIAVGLVLASANQAPPTVAGISTEGASAVTSAAASTAASTVTRAVTGTTAATATVPPIPVPVASTEVALATGSADIGPSPTPSAAPNISLIYDSKQFNLLNIGQRSLDITHLDFVQTGKASLSLGTSQWYQSRAPFSPVAMPPSACFQIARSGQPLPNTLKSCVPRTWTQVGSSRWFWIAQDDTVSTFEARLGSQTIQTCQIKAGQCDLTLP